MKEFSYIALDRFGREIRGVLSSEDLKEAKQKIRERGLYLINIQEKEVKRSFLSQIDDFTKYQLFNQLSILLKSGITIDKALMLCAESINHKSLPDVIEQISERLKAGQSVSDAFYETGEFSLFIITMLKIGEKTGRLKEVFQNISDYLLFTIKFKEEIKNAMIYPSFLVLASFIVLLVIFKIIIPKFFSLFVENLRELPFLSRVLFEISQSLTIKNSLIFVLIVLISFLILKRSAKQNIFQKLYNFILYVPFLRNLYLDLELSRFCFAMSSMLKSGVDFIISLQYSSELIKSEEIKKQFKETATKIKEGKRISQVFNDLDFLPPIFKGTIKVAEESGNLVEIFKDMHDYFDRRFKNQIKRLLSLLEPFIITIMGLIIGIIVFSLILTIMSVSNIKL